MPSLGWLRQRLLGLSPEEATVARRGFREGEAGVRQRLEQIGFTFLEGYHAALLDDAPETLAPRLAAVALR